MVNRVIFLIERLALVILLSSKHMIFIQNRAFWVDFNTIIDLRIKTINIKM